MSESLIPMSSEPASVRDKQKSRPACPVGESVCPVIDEVMRLRELVITDPLTGLYNLRYFLTALDQELERTERTHIATAVMMIDLDHFKSINDTWGHQAGDEVLRQTARIIRDSTRRLDIQCRYGGEEFVVILPSTERRLAVQVAERLRENIEFTPVVAMGREIHVTASIGIAFHSADHPCDATGLIAKADELLYEAKHKGRNQVCYPEFSVETTAVSGAEKDLLHGMFGGAPEADDAVDQTEDAEAGDDDWSDGEWSDDGAEWMEPSSDWDGEPSDPVPPPDRR
ncbi:GGDEF domain-containing protein [Thalassolituus sp. LLYu03]|uniref:GGDEF domain-containing protein n=1 Tax=Thalassolituus sp. LLYu03 TaxID=3421656 RepID=UPI003D285E88